MAISRLARGSAPDGYAATSRGRAPRSREPERFDVGYAMQHSHMRGTP